MSRLQKEDWSVYAILRDLYGKGKAEKFRHKKNRKYRELCIKNKQEDSWTLVKDYGMDGFIIKTFVPKKLTIDERVEITDMEWRAVPYPAYDCTGCPFSTQLSFYEVPAGTWIYHHISYDV